MSDVVMPRLSDTMEDGTILRWLKRDGQHVRRGEELVEIETDKAAMTYESDRDGVLATVAREGDTLPVGELIARIGEAERPSAPSEPSSPPAGGERVKASPLARRVARESGVDLEGLVGSGPGGRIVKADVEVAGSTPLAPVTPTAEEPRCAPGSPPSSPSGPVHPPAEDVASAKGETTVVELSRTQRTIARRMAESKATIPDFTLSADVDMERCVELRAELKRLSHADAPTFNDMIVKACALALRDYPRANGSYRDGRFELHSRVNVGVAVAAGAGASIGTASAGGAPTDGAPTGTAPTGGAPTDSTPTGTAPTGGALVVPTVFDADAKALGEIARETRALAERVRNGSITPPELSGGTFTVSNLGMYGIASFTAIVNPPQAAILAVGALAPRAVVRKKKLVARQTMSVTLACDHRILYGADAALFLARIRELLEEPAALTL
jgi:pyruvate dehydrogenase E2 component (dihydrolipoamide acetyltransferase)